MNPDSVWIWLCPDTGTKASSRLNDCWACPGIRSSW